jgi:phospholipase/carboxylesterase
VQLAAIAIPTPPMAFGPMVSDRPKAIGLAIILHGWGANAQDAAYFSGMMQLPQIQLLIPDAPFNHPYGGGKMWYGLPDRFGFQSDLSAQADLQTSRQLLLDWIRSLPEAIGVPTERTLLGGFSQGGAMSLEVGLELPLAGLMVLSGYLHKPLGKPLYTPPVLMIHGRQDPVVPLQAAHQTRDTLRQAGVAVQYEEFDMGHEVSPIGLAHLQTFIQARLGV